MKGMLTGPVTILNWSFVRNDQPRLLILVWLYNYHLFSPCCFLFCCCHIPPLLKLPATNLWVHPLTAQEKDTYWASPSGDFAFGFQQIGKGGYLLAIWFNKLPEKTVVWSANGDNLVPGGSKVELTKDGKFVLNDPTGNETWKADLAGPGVAYAAVLDTGNFVLASQNSSLLWQSFHYPTDTMLPSQTLSLGSKLVARYSEMNYSNGRFQFQLNTTGSLVLQTRAYPMDYSITDCWPGPEEPVGIGFRVVFNPSGSITFTARNGRIVKNISSIPDSTQDYYQRAIMEYDGVLRHYVYPKSSLLSRSGLMTWTACLGDCLCAAAIYKSGQCWKKKIPLSNGRMDYGFEGKALIKIRKDNSTLKPSGADLKKKDESTVILIVSVLLSSSVFLNLLFLLAVFLLVFRFKYWKSKAIKPYPVMLGMNLRSYTYEELMEATNGFREELGRGAFAKVYKGVLEYEDRKLVVVKRMNDMMEEGDLEFKAEVSAIGRTNHRNLVQLLGFCNEGQHRLLVYEFMSNGSLASFLFGVSRPYWKSFEAEAKDVDQTILADWAYHCYKDGKLELLVENDEEAKNDMKRVQKYVMIAIWCIQEDPSLRPTMKKVVQMMEGAVEVSVPPGPSSFISSI
nr:g-type lectin s-receptor-like serine/threonine-protein kinase lecrk2 [Quercus suber]